MSRFMVVGVFRIGLNWTDLSCRRLTLRACSVNFCRTFILSISLFLELADSNLAQTLLSALKFVWHWLYLQGMPASAKNGSSQNRIVSL